MYFEPIFKANSLLIETRKWKSGDAMIKFPKVLNKTQPKLIFQNPMDMSFYLLNHNDKNYKL